LYFEVYPEVPDIKYDDLEIKIAKNEVTQEQIDQMAELFRARHAEVKTMDDSVVEEGDFCSAKITSEGGDEESVFVRCSEKSFDAVEKSLVGKKCGEVYDLEIEDNQKKPKGKYKVAVSNVVRRVLPVLDDELAKKSGFASLEELMAKSKEKAEYENELRSKDERNKAIVRALLEKYKFDIPFSLLDRQIKNDAEALVNELSRQGRNINDLDWEKYFEIRRVTVENNIRAYFIVSKLIEQEKIEVSDEDLDAFLKNIAENEGLALQKVKEILEKNGQIEDIKFKLAEEKALENISKYVKINYVEETPEKDKGGNDADSDSR
jgi:trigger factor